eukprot:6126584-Pyramimonas_sp.AAC.1
MKSCAAEYRIAIVFARSSGSGPPGNPEDTNRESEGKRRELLFDIRYSIFGGATFRTNRVMTAGGRWALSRSPHRRDERRGRSCRWRLELALFFYLRLNTGIEK